MKTTDKKFSAAVRRLQQAQVFTACPARGQHLVRVHDRNEWYYVGGQRVRKYVFKIGVRPNAVRQARYLPASPKINGVRMRWQGGKLVPRHT